MQKVYLLICFFWISLLSSALAQQKHTVVAGNTLAALAATYYNDAEKWDIIYEANQGKDLEVVGNAPKRVQPPDVIYPGQILLIPKLMSDVEIAKAMIGIWIESKTKADAKFNADSTFSIGDKKGKYIVKNGNGELEGLGTFKIDQAKLKAGTISITQIKDSNDTVIKENYKIEFMPYHYRCRLPSIESISVSGKVTDKDTGKPIVGVKVFSGSSATKTDSNGVYKLNSVLEGRSLTFFTADYKSEEKTFALNIDVQLTSRKPKIVSAKGTVSVKAGKAGKEKGVPGVKLTGKNTTTFKATDKGKGDYDVELTYEEGKTPQIAAELAKYEIKSQNYTGGNATILLNAPAKQTKEKKK